MHPRPHSLVTLVVLVRMLHLLTSSELTPHLIDVHMYLLVLQVDQVILWLFQSG